MADKKRIKHKKIKPIVVIIVVIILVLVLFLVTHLKPTATGKIEWFISFPCCIMSIGPPGPAEDCVYGGSCRGPYIASSCSGWERRCCGAFIGKCNGLGGGAKPMSNSLW